MAWALRQLGVVEAPGTDAGIEMAGDGAGTQTVGIETSWFETTLALRAGDYLGVVMVLQQLGMTVDVETDVTCIGIEQLVLRAAICTKGDGGQHHKHLGEAGCAGHYCCHQWRTSACSPSTAGLRITVLVLVNETGVSWVSKWLR